ncbi:MAG: Flp family type IVb pilin [Oceanicaulis sp.]
MGAPGPSAGDRALARRQAARRRAARPAHGREGLSRVLADQRGSTAIEYALIAALLSVVVITGIAAFGSAQGGLWDTNTTSLNAVLGGSQDG